MEDKKMRSYAVIPPLLLDSRQRNISYLNNNGRCDDFVSEYKERQLLNVWSQAEKDIFKEKFLQHPKNFGVIAVSLEKKSVRDCVQYYYLSKKTENYKRLLRKSRQRTRSSRNPHGKVTGGNANSANANGTPMDSILNSVSGVTTRLQREQLQQKQEYNNQSAISGSSGLAINSVVNGLEPSDNNEEESSTILASNNSNEPCAGEDAVSLNLNSSSNQLNPNPLLSKDEIPCSSSPSPFKSDVMKFSSCTTSTTSSLVTHNSLPISSSSSHQISSVPSDSNGSLLPSSDAQSTSVSSALSMTLNSVAVSSNNNHILNSEVKVENKKKERRKEDKKKSDDLGGDTTDEELDAQSNDKGAVYPCAICKIDGVASRPLMKSQAAQYGLREEEVLPGARVCNPCHCKAIRSRNPPCPLPSCPNKGLRVKRLRSLSGKWNELPKNIKDPIIAEFQIPPNVTKCCSACFTRIARQLSPYTNGDEANNLLRWTDEEQELLKCGIREHGTRWSEVCKVVGHSKTQHQCKNFYFNYRKKLGLDLILQEYNKTHETTHDAFGRERKPALTDEEESGSSTSTCDYDQLNPGLLDSDTASASSPQRLSVSEDKIPSVESSAPEITGLTSSDKLPLEDRLVNSPANTTPASSNPAATNQDSESSLANRPGNKEDYDSSATETADEGIGETSGNGGDKPASTSPLTVKDLLSNVIEMQLMKNQLGGSGSQPPLPAGQQSIPPTISSILKMDHGFTVMKSREENSNLATLSVVSSQHAQQHVAQQDLPKEGLVVVQVQQALRENREPEPMTLDLSIKKPRSVSSNEFTSTAPPTSNTDKVTPSHPSLTVYSNRPHAPESYYHSQVVDVSRVSKSPSIFVTNATPTPHLVMTPHPQQPLLTVRTSHAHVKLPNKMGSPQSNSKLSPKLSPSMGPQREGTPGPPPLSNKLGGSIMHGTPVSAPSSMYPTSQESHYDPQNLLRQMTPPQVKESPPGSITQGTPVHQRSSSVYGADFYVQNSGKGPSARNSNSASAPVGGFYPPRPPAASYTAAEQRQIIMNDYITSQQMHTSAAPNTTRRPPSTPDKVYYQPTRQGVIQRHNTSKPPSPHHYPPGHEAFSSLVDVASRQPSLPVPIPDPHKDDKRFEGLGDRFNRDSAQERFPNREQDRFIRDNHQIPPHPTVQQQIAVHQQREREIHLAQQRELQIQQRQQQEERGRDMLRHQREREREHQLSRAKQMRDNQLAHEHIMRQQQQQHQQQQQQHQQQQQQHQQQQQQHQQQQQQQQQQQTQHQSSQHQTTQHSNSVSRLPEPQRMQHIPNYQQRMTPLPQASPSENDQARLIQVSTPHSFSRDSTPQSVSRSQPESREQTTTPSSQTSASRSSTMTAASLIDAIITHQINQTSDSGPQGHGNQPLGSRAGDRLFQSVHRDGPQQTENGKLSPMKPPVIASPDKEAPQRLITLGDHIDAIVNKGFAQPRAPTPHQQQVYQDYEPQAWKLRRVLQQKEMEAAAATARDKSEERNVVRVAGQIFYSAEQPLSPLDYVKNRIVEVMRTSEEDSNNKSRSDGSPSGGGDMMIDESDSQRHPSPRPQQSTTPHPPPPPQPFLTTANATYTYPFSALHLNSQVPPSVPVSATNAVVKTGAPPSSSSSEIPPEPAPLLSAQYEPLSDED